MYYDCAITVLTAETRGRENLIIPFYNLLLMTCNPYESRGRCPTASKVEINSGGIQTFR